MKIVSMASAAALLLGISAFMHATPALALLPCSTCATLYTECQQGNQQACTAWKAGCQGCPPRATVSGTPPVTHDDDASTAALNSHRGMAVAK
jgi:hypothetical protein